jgi:hypothetical protein
MRAAVNRAAIIDCGPGKFFTRKCERLCTRTCKVSAGQDFS